VSLHMLHFRNYSSHYYLVKPITFHILRSRDSSVSIATGYGLDGRLPVLGSASFLHSVQTDSGMLPASYPLGTGGDFPEVKRLRREADRSSPTSAESRMAELCLHSPICLHGIVLN
jgi:hypothetical protein